MLSLLSRILFRFFSDSYVKSLDDEDKLSDGEVPVLLSRILFRSFSDSYSESLDEDTSEDELSDDEVSLVSVEESNFVAILYFEISCLVFLLVGLL